MSRGSAFLRAVTGAALCVAAGAMAAGPALAGDDPRFNEQWGLSVIGAPAAWEAGTGGGITIAVVDTGVDAGHEDLQGKVLAGRNFVTPGASAQDDNGHGTHVAGIAAASTGNGIGVAGTAPGASILPVKVLDGGGGGTTANVAAGIRWAADQGAEVINLSLEPSVPLLNLGGPVLEEAVNAAWAKGSVVVIAAGNNFLFGSSYSTVNALVVTATTRDDRFASSYASSVGSAKWGIAAPGGSGGAAADNILSTYWRQGAANQYADLFGTSMATPHVAGAAAVLRGQGLTPQQTVDRLLATARDLGSPGRDATYGAGRLNLACAAGRCGGATTPTTAPPAPAGSTTTTPTTAPGPAAPVGSGSPGAGSSGGDTGASTPAGSGRGSTATTAGSTVNAPDGDRARSTRNQGQTLGPLGAASPGSPAPAPSAAGDTPAVAASGGIDPFEETGPDGANSSGAAGAGPGSSAAGVAVSEPRPSSALAGAAAGLLLLVASSALGLRRRRGVTQTQRD